jgi:hypothetical protein
VSCSYEHHIRSDIVCRNPSVKVSRARHDESTSNLVHHMDNCDPKSGPATPAIAAFAHGSMYTPGTFQLKLALWIARRHRLFAIVEDPEFLELLMILNNRVSVPSCLTISHDIQEIFLISRGKVSVMLKVCMFWRLSVLRD